MVEAEGKVETGIAHGCAFCIEDERYIPAEQNVLRADIAVDQHLARPVQRVGHLVKPVCKVGMVPRRMDKIGFDADGVKIIPVGEGPLVECRHRRSRVNAAKKPADRRRLFRPAIACQKRRLQKIDVVAIEEFHGKAVLLPRMAIKLEGRVRRDGRYCLQPGIFGEIARHRGEPVRRHAELGKREFDAKITILHRNPRDIARHAAGQPLNRHGVAAGCKP